jgi:transposase
MRRFVDRVDCEQTTLFPECLGDWIDENNPVQVIDAFVDELDLAELSFDGVAPEATGRPSYHRSMLLKLYICGCLNRVQSSRRLEREAWRKVEVMWLPRRLVPDHRTIADFRKDNGEAIRKVCARFIMLCRRLNLFAEVSVVIDGSKFKAVKKRDRNFTRAKMERRLAQIEESVASYLRQLDSADRREPSVVREIKTTRLKSAIPFPRITARGDLDYVRSVVKQFIRAASLRDDLSFTSFRRGGFTEGADSDLTDAELRAAGRHRSARQLRTYAKRTRKQLVSVATKRRAESTKAANLSE